MRQIVSGSGELLVEHSLPSIEAGEVRLAARCGEHVRLRREARSVADNVERHRGQHQLARVALLTLIAGIFQRPSIESAHLMPTTFSRLCPVGAGA